MNVLERKKLKSLNYGITYTQSFFVSYRITYSFNKRKQDYNYIIREKDNLLV